MRRYNGACLGAVVLGCVCGASAQSTVTPVDFFPAENVSLPAGSLTLELSAIAAGDFNGDGRISLVVGSTNIALNTPPVIVLDNDGAGKFTVARELNIRDRPGSIVVADFNDDGHLDLAIALLGSDEVAVLLGTGAGSFLDAVRYPTGDTPVHLAVGDLNGDGQPDLVTSNRSDDTMTVLLNLGDDSGGFAEPFNVSVRILDGGVSRSEPSGAVIGDFNNDGFGDIAVTLPRRNQVAVLLNDGDSGFSQITQTHNVDRQPVALAAGQLNSDNHLDLVVANEIGDSVNIGLGDGQGGFTFGQPLSIGNGPVAVAIADLNNDGRADIAATNSQGNRVGVLAGRGDGSFEDVRSFAVGAGPSALVIAELNGDGRLDIAVANRTAGLGAAADVSLLAGRVFTSGLDDLDNLTGNCNPGCGPLGMAPFAFTLLSLSGLKLGARRRRSN